MAATPAQNTRQESPTAWTGVDLAARETLIRLPETQGRELKSGSIAPGSDLNRNPLASVLHKVRRVFRFLVPGDVIFLSVLPRIRLQSTLLSI